MILFYFWNFCFKLVFGVWKLDRKRDASDEFVGIERREINYESRDNFNNGHLRIVPSEFL